MPPQSPNPCGLTSSSHTGFPSVVSACSYFSMEAIGDSKKCPHSVAFWACFHPVFRYQPHEFWCYEELSVLTDLL